MTTLATLQTLKEVQKDCHTLTNAGIMVGRCRERKIQNGEAENGHIPWMKRIIPVPFWRNGWAISGVNEEGNDGKSGTFRIPTNLAPCANCSTEQLGCHPPMQRSNSVSVLTSLISFEEIVEEEEEEADTNETAVRRRSFPHRILRMESTERQDSFTGIDAPKVFDRFPIWREPSRRSVYMTNSTRHLLDGLVFLAPNRRGTIKQLVKCKTLALPLPDA